MTSVAVALSIDSRGPSGLYVLTDSRITWGGPNKRWDGGQKTFCSRRFPDVFGYCGDAYFPPIMLNQIIEQLDAGLICPDFADAEERHKTFVSAMNGALDRRDGDPPMSDFVIYHGARVSVGMQSKFRLWESRYSKTNSAWTDVERDINKDHSYMVHVDGSGSQPMKDEDAKWQATTAARTSRSSVWAFFDALRSSRDLNSGGPPQMVGVWRIGNGQHFGLVWNGWPYLAGLRVVGDQASDQVRWFNENFDPCDPNGKPLRPEKAHTRPGTG